VRATARAAIWQLAILVAPVLLLGAACNGGTDSPPSSATASAVSPAPTAAATAGPSSARSNDGAATDTADPRLDRVIAAVAARDPEALSALLLPHRTACAHGDGIGRPPPCSSGREAGLPEGSAVEAFPVLSCELEWHADLRVVASLLLERAGDFHSALRFAKRESAAEPYLPRPDAGLIFTNPRDPRGATLLLLEGAAVVAGEWTCGGGPGELLDGLWGPAELTQRGPAYSSG